MQLYKDDNISIELYSIWKIEGTRWIVVYEPNSFSFILKNIDLPLEPPRHVSELLENGSEYLGHIIDMTDYQGPEDNAPTNIALFLKAQGYDI